MTAITHQNMHSFCRTCLTELNGKSSLMCEKYSIQDDIEGLITMCAPLPLEDDIKFPDFVCRTCHEKLKSFYDFRCQTMKSLCILSNIIKEFKEKKAAKEECRGLDSGQGSEDNFENMEGNVTDEIHDNKGKAREATTRSQEKLQNCIENTVVKIMQDPTDCPLGLVLKSDSINEICEEIEEKEIYINDVKVESQCDVLALDYLDLSPKRSPNTPNAEDNLQIMDISLKVSPGMDETTDDEERAELNEDCPDSSTRSSKKSKSVNSAGLSIKKSTKSTNNLAKKSTKSQSQSVIGGGPKFQCDQCPRRCVTFENYEAHLRTHQGLKPFLCKECGRSFNKAFRCREHVREVHAPVALQFICSYEGCGKVFQREGTYQMHYRLKHKYAGRESRKYVCEECGSTLKNATRFREHRLKHLSVEEYPFKCEECGKRYRSKRSFKEHQLRHSGIKKFICPYCGMKKTTQKELRTHINYHTKERQWPCSKCTSVFNSSANLGMHDRVVHKGIRRFACKYCDQSFGKPDTLKHHEMRHTGEKPHGCDICGKRFIQSVALRAHMKVHSKGSARSANKLSVNDNVVTVVEKTTDSEGDCMESIMESVNEVNCLIDTNK